MPNDLRERRERLGLSRERLARLADVSSASIELFEGGWRPQRSRVLPAVMAALGRAEAEREMANEKRLGERRVVLTTSPGGQAQHAES